MKSRHPLIKFAYIITTGFGSGLSPVAPGTAGTAVATVLSLFYTYYFQEPELLGFAILLAALILLGWICMEVCVQNLDDFSDKDPQQIVVDEILGYLVVLLFVKWSFLNLILGFFVFRLFDIWKPSIIGWADRRGGTFSVLLDDLLAGLFGGLCLLAFNTLLH